MRVTQEKSSRLTTRMHVADHTYACGRGLAAGPGDPEAIVLPFRKWFKVSVTHRRGPLRILSLSPIIANSHFPPRLSPAPGADLPLPQPPS